MKKIFPPLLLLTALCAGLPAAEDCSKNLDACSGSSKKSSPFVQASLRENLPPAPEAAKAKRAVLREAPVPAAPAAAPASAEARTAPAPSPEAAQEPAAGSAAARRPLSSPLWMLFAGAALAVLYFYLSGGRRKGRRK